VNTFHGWPTHSMIENHLHDWQTAGAATGSRLTVGIAL
jgi:hypothetical protein